MDLKAFASAIAQIAEEKSLPEEKILEAVELALAAAYKRDYASRGEQIRVSLDPKSGAMRVFKIFLVVDDTMIKPEGTEDEGASSSPQEEEDHRFRFNPERHMFIADAKKIKGDVQPGDELLIELEPHEEFGRIAAQTAKQVIVQRIREIEREAIAEEYADKVGEIVSGIVQRVEGRTIYIDLGRGIGILFPQDQIPGEFLRLGSRVRALLKEVNVTPRGPQIVLSRAHPDFVKRLFEMEVPEIAAGIVEIKAIAREAGSRTKIAVASKQARVDPIGACVGQRGTRVLTVINELNGEKIDVIEWSDDTERFIANALAPAKVTSVELHERTTATVKVPEDQLSLAIGREGQNVRLAVKLTNWKIDIEGAEAFLEGEEATEGKTESERSEETGVDVEDAEEDSRQGE
jgi:N utilization substance protein A